MIDEPFLEDLARRVFVGGGVRAVRFSSHAPPSTNLLTWKDEENPVSSDFYATHSKLVGRALALVRSEKLPPDRQLLPQQKSRTIPTSDSTSPLFALTEETVRSPGSI